MGAYFSQQIAAKICIRKLVFMFSRYARGLSRLLAASSVSLLIFFLASARPALAQSKSKPAASVPAETATPETGVTKDVVQGRALAFDVVSIKPVAPGGRPTHGWVGMQVHPDGVEFAFQNVRGLIQSAYGAKRFPLADQITDLPDWTQSQLYDIDAKMSAEDIAEFQKLDRDGQEQWREAMMQAMLAQRFQLKVHRGTRQAPVFEMVVAKGGSKMKDAATDPNPPLGKGDDGKPHTGIRWEKDTSVIQMEMGSFVQFLSSPVAGIGRPVVDKTGLTGVYSFPFDWSVYSASEHASQRNADGSPADPGPSILTALGEIGLKLQPVMGTLDTIAVDHVEKPAEN